MFKSFSCISFIFFSINGFCIDISKLNDTSLVGVYKAGKEILHLKSGGQFYLEREKSKLQDVAVLACEYSIANGSWQVIRNGIIKLSNNKNFENVIYNVKQENKLSADTTYIEIKLPNIDSSLTDRFVFRLNFVCDHGIVESKKKLIKIRKIDKGNCSLKLFGLVVKDESPYCDVGSKCYQRIYFRIFDLYQISSDSNYITVTLNNFDQCFAEQMDVDNELLLLKGRNIYWRGNIYKKIL